MSADLWLREEQSCCGTRQAESSNSMESNCSMSLFVRVYALGFRVWGFRVLQDLSRKHDKHTQACKISDISACKARAGTSRHLPDTRRWQLKFQAKLLLHNSLTSYCKKSQTCTHLCAVRTYVAGVTATGAACAKKRVLRILLEGCAVPSFSKKPTTSRIGIMQMKAKLQWPMQPWHKFIVVLLAESVEKSASIAAVLLPNNTSHKSIWTVCGTWKSRLPLNL